MKQILARLLAEMNAMRVKMDASQDEIDDGQEEMKEQVVSVACRIGSNQRDMTAKVHVCA